MIINHEYRFIYLKTKKTASTSLEIALSRFCGPADTLSKIGGRDEPIRTNLGYQGPANYLIPRDRWTRRDWFRHYLRGKEICFWNHMPAREIRERIGPGIFDSYFKFCFERNPWDRAISAYHWENRSRRKLPDFHRFLRKLERKDLISNWDTYAVDDRIIVDKVYRYEDLAEAKADIVQRLGLPGDLELPDAKRQYRKDRRPYQQAYTERERDFVATACAREIREFGYTF